MTDTNAVDTAETMATPNTSPDFVWPIAMEKRNEIGFLAELLEETYEHVAARADKLTKFASNLRSGIGCQLAPRLMNSGGTWVIRVLNFDDGVRWVARLALYPSRSRRRLSMRSEIDTMSLLKERGLPVPELYGYDLTGDIIGRPFMLMEFLPYNSTIDMQAAWVKHPSLYPFSDPSVDRWRLDWPDNFLRSMAEFQVRLTSIRAKGIGRITKGQNGELVVSPAPDQSAVHITTRSYLEDWIDRDLSVPVNYATFYNMSDEWADKSLKGLRSFPPLLEKIAATFADDDGAEQEAGFPIIHKDFGCQDILVDGDLNMAAVVDWTGAHTVPWCLVKFPEEVGRALPETPGYELFESGMPEWYEKELKRLEKYVGFVREAEHKFGTDDKLSSTLTNLKFQHLNQAMAQFSRELGPPVELLEALWLNA